MSIEWKCFCGENTKIWPDPVKIQKKIAPVDLSSKPRWK